MSSFSDTAGVVASWEKGAEAGGKRPEILKPATLPCTMEQCHMATFETADPLSNFLWHSYLDAMITEVWGTYAMMPERWNISAVMYDK